MWNETIRKGTQCIEEPVFFVLPKILPKNDTERHSFIKDKIKLFLCYFMLLTHKFFLGRIEKEAKYFEVYVNPL